MEAKRDDLTRLLQVQDIDLEILRQKKKFDELPQREQIVQARRRKEAIGEKKAKVASLKKEIERKITRVGDEDASLVKKQQGVQAAMDAAKGDYRNVEARSKELAGIMKRRETLEGDMNHLTEELDKAQAVYDQAERALADVTAKEEESVVSFQKIGGKLKQEIASNQEKRDAILTEVDPALVRVYEKVANRTGGVAISYLQDNRCGACRSTIESGRLIELRAQAPLGTCPHCKRLLIIE